MIAFMFPIARRRSFSRKPAGIAMSRELLLRLEHLRQDSAQYRDPQGKGERTGTGRPSYRSF